MSLLFGTEVVLFPSLEGVLTYRGEPASGAKVSTRVFWKDQVGEEEVFTADSSGFFSIPEKKRRVRIPPLAEFVATQQIRVNYKGDEYVIWSKATHGTDKYGGLGGTIKNLRCELTDRRVKQENFEGLFSTSCQWEIE